jgi:hypothetical protein
MRFTSSALLELCQVDPLVCTSYKEYEDLLITELFDPGDVFDSEYGHISWITWLRLECDRIEEAGIRCQVLINGGGRMALKFVDESERDRVAARLNLLSGEEA